MKRLGLASTGCDGARIQPDRRWGYGTEEVARRQSWVRIPCHGDVFISCREQSQSSGKKCNCPKANPEQEMVVAKKSPG